MMVRWAHSTVLDTPAEKRILGGCPRSWPQTVPVADDTPSTAPAKQDQAPKAQQPEKGGDSALGIGNPAASIPTPALSFVPILLKQPPPGTDENRRGPSMLPLAVFLVLRNARNLQFTAFQKIVGVWLFAHTALYGIYTVLGRTGHAVSYTLFLSLLSDPSPARREGCRAHEGPHACLPTDTRQDELNVTRMGPRSRPERQEA
ncbi:hypothetical protein FIBSPDRAFT_607778 [Athelia psychrophila]|uniref:Uncharacterized protein n=1 Tax=Athelia psychrophila TaxID=1759441 RepID=A0A166GGX4_9AGAM|nr:hypothetical protein FIBSPDRAFT_607778 [Fibularhizoctonia sp. CBS 109695]